MAKLQQEATTVQGELNAKEKPLESLTVVAAAALFASNSRQLAISCVQYVVCLALQFPDLM